MIEIDVTRQLGNLEISAKIETQTRGVLALFGQSGSGKTSIVNMVAGLLNPDSGRVKIDGRVLFDSESGINLQIHERRIGYVFQESRLFPHMSVLKNLNYGRRRAPNNARQIDFDDVIEVLGIKHLIDQKPYTLSGGERQRVALGRALLANPDILLMDEPLASLDVARKSEILPFIEMIRDRFEVPMIYVSHSMDEIIRLADTLVLVDDGQVKAVGPLEELTSRLDLRRLTGRYDAGSVIAAKIESHDEEFGLTTLTFKGGKLRVPRVKNVPGTSVRIRIRARDVSLSLEKPSQVSQLNVLEGRISELRAHRLNDDGSEPHDIDICVDIGVSLWVRITRWSLAQMKLVEGQSIYALIKSTSIDRQSLGQQHTKDHTS
ncbi:MAG: molybdenum ABC transporter ATP-binding protein [Rhodospirillaceae bacterium]|nr:molybdenum ABC transporter ATP-binding protein [Rhodospirillaceae bacterium]|tara:strand:+ start:6388 stop:7518 length:1131 start_codon:yes stop_codon:yes gene_type:complete